MIRLIHAEAIKLRSTRTFYLITFGALVMIAIAAAVLAAAGSFAHGDQPVRDALAIAALGQTFAIVLGVMAVTGEFRHRTITAALLITPKRARLIVAKTVVVFLAGLAFGLVAFAGTVAIVLPILSARHIASDVSGTQIAEIMTGGNWIIPMESVTEATTRSIIRNGKNKTAPIWKPAFISERM